ncbi:MULTISPECIES: mechanosensitive ion channel family protein [Alkalihalophilus]|uniref:Mechanosensitive ion channel family protein n=1 Tax=Alkalihalophilus pseudofirmus TaxID=79885 RepID=A0AAJ2NN74_ALKPS|nr:MULTISPECIES: mechanosensitive ion channel family protein [Alkalihalophilus]MDV2885454.1 mechanosensitive ion channel family protein [Alkalihalophilus pseudofirmus]MEC2072926.1 mechanosensitive ion channel family protein [Alkalihalophilus marmarensis]WEG15792.1 mechanosensitive ion channel family protein [Alkalihalophilus pseudofirmus]
MDQWTSYLTEGAFLTAVLLVIGQLFIAIIAFLIVRAIGRRIISSGFERMQAQKNMTHGRMKTLEKLTLNIFSYILIFVFVTIIAGIFELPIGGLIAGAGVVGLAIGFGAQGLVSDVVTGFFLLLEKQIDVDDYVTAAGIDGVVEEVGLRTTQIRGFDGTLHFVPNREISSVSNHSRGNMRALIDMSISYDDNIDEAIAVMQSVCDKIALEDETIKEGPNVIGVQGLGDSDVVIRVIAKTENMMQWAVERKLRKELKEALDANNIEIPYPHQVYIEKK